MKRSPLIDKRQNSTTNKCFLVPSFLNRSDMSLHEDISNTTKQDEARILVPNLRLPVYRTSHDGKLKFKR